MASGPASFQEPNMFMNRMHSSLVLMLLGALGCGGSEREQVPPPQATAPQATAREAQESGAAGVRAVSGDTDAAQVAEPVRGEDEAPSTSERDPAARLDRASAPDSAREGARASAAGRGGPSSDGAMAFDLGQQLGEQTARSAWQSLSRDGSCEPLGQLAEVLGRAARRIGESSERFERQEMLDYAEGYVAGMRAGVADVAERCSSDCAVLCDAIGSASRSALCSVVRHVGGAVQLGRGRSMPAVACAAAAGSCGALPASLGPGDCP
jgi:hypothetical protein